MYENIDIGLFVRSFHIVLYILILNPSNVRIRITSYRFLGNVNVKYAH